MAIFQKTLAGTCEITTGTFTPTTAMPMFTGENNSIVLSVAFQHGGVDYDIPPDVTVRAYLYYGARPAMTPPVLMDAVDNVASCALPDTFMPLSGSPQVVVRMVGASSEVVVACAFAINVKAVTTDNMVYLSPPNPDTITYIGRSPYIGENGNWYTFSNTTYSYVDTGTSAVPTADDISTDTTDVSVQDALNAHTSQLAENTKRIDGANGYNLDAGLRKWRYNIALLDYAFTDTGIVNLNVLWDSIGEGANGLPNTIADHEKAVVPMLRNKIAARYGGVGEGFVHAQYPAGAAVKRWTYTGAWTTNGVVGWAQSAYCKQATLEAGATATLNFRGTGIVVMFQAHGSLSQYNPSTTEVRVDGVLLDTKSTYTGGTSVVTSTITGLVYGNHTLLLTHVEGRTVLLGAYETGGAAKGIRVNKIAAAGANVADFVYYDGQIVASIDYWQPKLTIMGLLANDYLDQTSISSFKASYQTLITRAKAHGDVLLIAAGQFFPDEGAITNGEYVNAMYELADDNDCALLDFTERWGGGYTTANAIGYVGDGHPTSKGHQDIASVLYDLLIPQAVAQTQEKNIFLTSASASIVINDDDAGAPISGKKSCEIEIYVPALAASSTVRVRINGVTSECYAYGTSYASSAGLNSANTLWSLIKLNLDVIAGHVKGEYDYITRKASDNAVTQGNGQIAMIGQSVTTITSVTLMIDSAYPVGTIVKARFS